MRAKMTDWVPGEGAEMMVRTDHHCNKIIFYFNDLVAVDAVGCEPVSVRDNPCYCKFSAFIAVLALLTRH
jgi:hypothetical protein